MSSKERACLKENTKTMSEGITLRKQATMFTQPLILAKSSPSEPPSNPGHLRDASFPSAFKRVWEFSSQHIYSWGHTYRQCLKC